MTCGTWMKRGKGSKSLGWLVLGSFCLVALQGATALGQDGKRDPRPPAGKEAVASRPAETQPATTRPATTRPATTQPATTRPAEAAKPKMVPLAFNGAGMNDVARFLTDQYGKPVIVSKEVSSIQVTLVNPKELPADEALGILATALCEVGVAIEEREKTVHLIPVAQVAQAQIPTIGADVELKTIKPTSKIVRKMFNVRQADTAKLAEVINPLLPATYSKATADPATGKLMVVATVERLLVVESLIRELDTPGAVGGELRVFPIKHVDIYEIIPVLEKLVAGSLGVEAKGSKGGSGGDSYSGYDRYDRYGYRSSSSSSNVTSAAPAPGAVVIKNDKTPVLLIPDPRRSAIIVSAPGNVLAQIDKWLKELDQEKPPSVQNEMIEVQFVEIEELVNRLTTMLNSLPDEGLRNALRIFPFPASRKIMLVGSEQNRQVIKEWIKQIDVAETGVRITETFNLKNADAQQIADNIKELFEEGLSMRARYIDIYNLDMGSGGSENRTKVTVTANVRNNSVTVRASPEKMKRIAAQIEIWDKPLEGNQARPRIFDLKYADPEKTKTLLEGLFTKKQSGSDSFLRNIFGGGYDDYGDESTPAAVGRLFGQFRFEAYPETGKLVVVSKNEENYKVIEDMIKEIDRPQTAGRPRIIQLKFADAETLAEQLNALLNAPGTPASILRRSQAGNLKDMGSDESPFRNGNDQPYNQNGNNGRQQQQQQSSGVMQFWWQNPPSEMIKTRQPSNLVGKLRIVPNVEQNLLLVAAPEEYVESIEAFVQDLDKPGQQVLIKAVIAEITLDDSMSLGYRFSTVKDAFTSGDALVTDDALRGVFSYAFKDAFDNRNSFTFDIDVNNLLSLLHRKIDLKIRSEPKVFTADNVEAEFFDGQDIPFIKDSNFSGVSGVQNQTFDYKAVGIRLRVRPHITKERNIDLTVNLLVSSIVPGQTLFGGAIVDRRETTTRIVLEDGKTFMISGILREEDRNITRGIPGISDIPLVGEVFKHHEVVKANREVLIFLTPYVISQGDPRRPVETEPMERLKQYYPDPKEKDKDKDKSKDKEQPPVEVQENDAALTQDVDGAAEKARGAVMARHGR